MQIIWNDKDPIYRQLHDRLVEMILEGIYKDGDSIPSVRRIAGEHRINPITVSRAFQMLVDEGLVEKRRGLGMYVTGGARDKLIRMERDRFLTEEWPRIRERMARLGLNPEDLLGGNDE